MIVFCWAFAILPAIPMMFNTTIEKNWENKTDCKCFYPIDDVRNLTLCLYILNKVEIWTGVKDALRTDFER